MAGEVAIREVAANGERFVCREMGVGGEPVVLLHGFPETSRMWVRLMSELAAAGYHCLAPDQRGYSPGARPVAVEDYSYEHLAADVHALAEAAGFDRFHLVAHDWGANAAWATLAANPEPIASFVSLSIPHYHAFAEAAWADPAGDLYRSFLDLFTAPNHLAEETISPDDFAIFKELSWTSSSAEEIADYLDVFRQEGALTGALNWYRACRGHRRALDDATFEFGEVATPTVLLWGQDDPYALRMSVNLASDLMTGDYRVVELPAGHWLVQDCPEAVKDEVSAHLARHSI